LTYLQKDRFYRVIVDGHYLIHAFETINALLTHLLGLQENGHRQRQKSTPVILAVNLLSRLGRDAKHAVCVARIIYYIHYQPVKNRSLGFTSRTGGTMRDNWKTPAPGNL
jgi:hypothetical protein